MYPVFAAGLWTLAAGAARALRRPAAARGLLRAQVGAALQKTPGRAPADPSGSIFAFPQVRDWLSFTAEAAMANTTCLIVGLAASAGHAARLRLVKPLVRSGKLHGHFHAAAFPYRPLRKGRVELADTAQPLFESEQVLGLLHLLNDWRPANGAGESRFVPA